jgi:DNA-directed RNA polymerase subunit M/transcription elongation factor TFIIS
MKCPHCGNELRFMVAEDITRFTSAEDGDVVLEVLFNCEKCTHDWRAEIDIPYDENLYPKFWG